MRLRSRNIRSPRCSRMRTAFISRFARRLAASGCARAPSWEASTRFAGGRSASSATDRSAGKRRGWRAPSGRKGPRPSANRPSTPAGRADPGWSPAGLGDPDGKIPARFFGPDEREAILRESDYVSVTLPLTDHTRKFIGEREFAAMKPGAYLVNIGRGEVIDEHAMATALSAKKIGGAGLDVFEHEPLEASSPLWDLENVILTPHISGANRGYMDKACELFAENLKRFAVNRPLLNLVDPNLGY